MSGPRSRLTAIALLAVLVVLAGCSFGLGGSSPADSANSTGSTASTDSDGSGVENGSDGGLRTVSLANSSIDLPADRIFDEVEALVDEDVDAPTVQVVVGQGAGSGAFSYPHTPYGFVEDMALTDVSSGGDSAAGVTDYYGSVYLVEGNATPTAQTKVLVHEYVHTVQRRADLLSWDPLNLAGNVPTDEAQTKLALTEGAAVWVTDRYVERHMEPNVTLQSERIARAYEEARVGGRFFLARYHFGAIGVDRRIDEPSQLRALYEEDVPETTEQLVHGYGPDEEPMAPVAVDATDGDGWEIQDPEDEDRLGELFVRVALSKELSLEASAAAADGWAYDRLIEYERDGEPAYAWVTRWDDPANATEFASAFETYADRRSGPADQTFGVDRVGDDVVAIYSGPPAFVEAATATLDGETVRLRVGQ